MLEACQGEKPTRKTHLMYGANLSHAQVNLYLKFLLERDLMEEATDDRGNDAYRTLPKGEEAIKAYYSYLNFYKK